MTYSIVARDRDTGDFGVAVQSHYFSVGPVVPWARPGVGAIATQAMVDVTYGPKGLDLLAAGVPAPEALAQLLAVDPSAGSRQVAFVDTAGRAAAHTGADAIPEAGHVVGDGVACQGNIMASAAVWPAMLDAYEAASGPLPDRLIAALDAAEAEGGDIRGRQSAALIVVPATGDPWEQVVELRVEDDPEPLRELRRLLGVHHAYRLASEGDDLLTAGDRTAAADRFARALELAPGNHELLFWTGLTAVEGGEIDGGLVKIREAIALHPGWTTLLPRIPPSVAPAAAIVCDRLGLTPADAG